MGGPSAAIVLEELIALGARRAIRVGTCGALDRGLALGDLVIAREAICADGTSRALGAGERVAADAQLSDALAQRRTGRARRARSSASTCSTSATALAAPSATRSPSRWRRRRCSRSARARGAGRLRADGHRHVRRATTRAGGSTRRRCFQPPSGWVKWRAALAALRASADACRPDCFARRLSRPRLCRRGCRGACAALRPAAGFARSAAPAFGLAGALSALPRAACGAAAGLGRAARRRRGFAASGAADARRRPVELAEQRRRSCSSIADSRDSTRAGADSARSSR